MYDCKIICKLGSGHALLSTSLHLMLELIIDPSGVRNEWCPKLILWADWNRFLRKLFPLSQQICLAVGHVSKNGLKTVSTFLGSKATTRGYERQKNNDFHEVSTHASTIFYCLSSLERNAENKKVYTGTKTISDKASIHTRDDKALFFLVTH